MNVLNSGPPGWVRFPSARGDIPDGLYKVTITGIKCYDKQKNGVAVNRIRLTVQADGEFPEISNSWFLSKEPSTLFGKTLRPLLDEVPDDGFDPAMLIGLRVKIRVTHDHGFLNFEVLKRLNKKVPSANQVVAQP